MSKRTGDEYAELRKKLNIWKTLGEERLFLTEQTKRTRIHEQIGEMIQQGMWRKMLI